MQFEKQKVTTQAYLDNWEAVFGKRQELQMGQRSRVVIERGGSNTGKCLSIVCPKCQAPKGHLCDRDANMVHAERVAELFAQEAKPLVGPFYLEFDT